MKLFVKNILSGIICLGLSLFHSSKLQADSPITSTVFYHYSFSEMKPYALKLKNGKLDKKLVNYIINNDDLFENLSLVNALGWSLKGKRNQKVFLKQLKKIYLIKNEKDLIEMFDTDLMILYAYLGAMDDYFNVEDELKICRMVLDFDSGSVLHTLIYSLIYLQDIQINSMDRPYQKRITIDIGDKYMDLPENALGCFGNYITYKY